MSLRALRTLVAIARHGTFARAADAIGLTQSAVSLHVKALEQEFGALLFDRTHRQPVLTVAGQTALERAREILALYDAIAGELTVEGELAGRFRLGAIQTALVGVLPEALAVIRARHPRLRIQVYAGLSAELANRVEAGDLDAAITTGLVKPHPAGLTATPLYQDGFWLLGPPGLLAATAAGLLDSLPFIRFDAQAWAGRMVDRELRRLGLQVQEDMVLDSQQAIIRMVVRGLGVAIVPLSTRERAELPPCTCLPFGEPQCHRDVVLLERDERAGHRVARALVQAICGHEHSQTHDKNLP
jgi:DNA-binding transcriptional LysR family regulator